MNISIETGLMEEPLMEYPQMRDEPSFQESLGKKYYSTPINNPDNVISSSLADVFVFLSKYNIRHMILSYRFSSYSAIRQWLSRSQPSMGSPNWVISIFLMICIYVCAYQIKSRILISSSSNTLY